MIATALPEEFEAIRVLESGSVRVVLTGDGPARAAAALSTFEGIPTLIGAGVCGALSPALQPGDILVSERVVDESGDAPSPSKDLIPRAVAAGAKVATFVTVSRPLISSNEKRRAAARVGAEEASGVAAAAVDMESAAWARAAARVGAPYVVLRSVADTFEESLPSFLADCLDGSGSIDRARVARLAALQPWSLPRLLAMRGRVRAASAGLAAFLGRFLEGGLARA